MSPFGLLLLLLSFSLSLSTEEEIEPCPYLYDSQQPLPEGVPVTTMTRHPYGRLGNWIRCVNNAMVAAISCSGVLKLPFLPDEQPFGRRELTFYFNTGKRLSNCGGTFTGGCPHYYYKNIPITTHEDERSHASDEYRRDIFPILSKCLNVYLNFNRSLCPMDLLKDALVIHIRNGDNYEGKPHSKLGQQPLCSLLAAMEHRLWRRILVVAETLNPQESRSGPLLQFLYSIKDVFRSPIVFVNGTFFDHLVLRTCAAHLYISHTTMNYLNHYHPFLESLFDPCAIQCPLYPPKSGWTRNTNPVIVYRVNSTPALVYNSDWVNSPEQHMKMLSTQCSPYVPCHYFDNFDNVTVTERKYEVMDNPTCHI